MWIVEFERAAEKAVANLHPQIRKRVLDAIEVLAADPFKTRHVKSLKGSSNLRLRVGEYRVVYRLEKNHLIVVIVDVGPRSGIYD